MKTVFKLKSIALALAILVACGGAEPTPTPQPTATPAPAAAPTATSAPTPAPTPMAQAESPLAGVAPDSPLAGVGPDSPLAGVAPDSPLAQPATGPFSDPFAYCAAVGTIDEPDERYIGDESPESIARGLRVMLETPDTPLSVYQGNMVWRCMDGMVYACTVGANLPCSERADLSTVPTEAMIAYCEEEPNSEFIPMVVTGRATVYPWSCVDGEPQAGEPLLEVDDRGFLADLWYPIEEAAIEDVEAQDVEAQDVEAQDVETQDVETEEGTAGDEDNGEDNEDEELEDE